MEVIRDYLSLSQPSLQYTGFQTGSFTKSLPSFESQEAFPPPRFSCKMQNQTHTHLKDPIFNIPYISSITLKLDFSKTYSFLGVGFRGGVVEPKTSSQPYSTGKIINDQPGSLLPLTLSYYLCSSS